MTADILPFKLIKKSGSSPNRYNPTVKLFIELATNGLRLQTFDYYEEFPIIDELYLTKTKTRSLGAVQDVIYSLGLEQFFTASIRKTPLKHRISNNINYIEVELLEAGYVFYTYDTEGATRHRAEMSLKGVKKQEQDLLENIVKSLGLHNFIKISKIPHPK